VNGHENYMEKYRINEFRRINLKEFLVNLPVFHNRIMLIYPKLTTPEFKSEPYWKQIVSTFIFFLKGKDYKSLLEDCCRLENYMVWCIVELIQSRNEGSSHEVLK
jgi:hypothetical protein